MNNEYIPFKTQIREVIKHTDIEYTFRVTYKGDVKPGQFFEVSLPKFGEAPISVSGIKDDTVDLTIRKVGVVTNEIFEHYVGDTLFMRGPYGNGFDVDDYKNKEIVVISGGTGLSPVKGVVDYFAGHKEESKSVTLIAGFKSPDDILFKEELKFWEDRINLVLTVDSDVDNTGHKVGLVTEYIKDLKPENLDETVAIVVGPPMMMKFAVEGLLEFGFREENIWVSYERKMCCGIGKCGHCKVGDTYICLDGPVFNYTKSQSLID